MSFVQKVADKQFVIKKFDMSTGIITTIINALPGQDQICWLQNGILLTSDGSKLFSYQESSFIEVKDRKWQPVIPDSDVAMLKGVTRLATNSDNTKLAIVVSE